MPVHPPHPTMCEMQDPQVQGSEHYDVFQVTGVRAALACSHRLNSQEWLHNVRSLVLISSDKNLINTHQQHWAKTR